jgi:SLT domain-containing protein
LAGSNTLRFDIVGDASSASRAFRQTADDAVLAARGAKQLSDSLGIQSKSAVASAAATVSLAKSDKTLADAQAVLAGSTDEATNKLQAQGRAAEDTAVKTQVAGAAAKDAGGGFGALATPMGALIGAGVVLSPVIATVGTGLGGLAAAAYGTVSPILAAGTATKQAQQALAGLDPAQRAAYDSLGALKTQFSSFSKSLEPEVLTLFSQGLDGAEGALRVVQPIAAATGKALSGVLSEVGQEMRSGEWQQFFTFMEKTAGPDVQLLGGTLISLANDLPPLLEGLQPVAVELLTLADGAAKAVGAVEALPSKINQVSDSNDSLLSKASGWLNTLSSKIPAGNRSLVSLAEQWLGVGKSASQSVTPQQQATDAATALSANLTTLEARYGLTAGQATALVKASGQTTQALSGTDTAAAGALKAVEGYANANLAAKSPTTQLAGDIAVLGNNTLGATAQLNAFSDAWNLLVGNSVSDQQAVLATSQAFQTMVNEVKNSGAQSLASQSDFLSYMSSIGQGLSTLQKNGASVRDVNAYYETNIQRLQALHNLTPAQRADVQGLVKDYDTWAHSTAGLNQQTLTAAQTVKDRFTVNLKALGEYTPGINTDVNNLATAVLRTGTTSSATQGDRAKLIADLNHVGIYGQAATTLVDGLERKIAGLKGKTVAVDVTIGGEGAIVASAVGLPARIFKLSHMAAGGRVAGSGSGDTVPAMLTPGEVVVPVGMVKGGAVDHLRGRLPGFAAGGLVDAPPWAGAQGSGAAGGWAGSWVQGEVAAFFTAARAAAAAAAAAGTPVAYSKVAGVTQWETDVSKVLSWLGLPQSDLPTVMSQIQTESGGNPNAINLADINAQRGDPSKGLMQVISETFAAYRSPSLSPNIYDPLANIYAGVNYAVHRYGNPGWLSVLGHGHGYANGTSSARPGLALVGERGPELVNFRGGEQVIPHQFVPGGGSGGTVHVHLHNEGVIGSQAELDNWLNNGIDRLARSSRLTYAMQRSPSAAR